MGATRTAGPEFLRLVPVLTPRTWKSPRSVPPPLPYEVRTDLEQRQSLAICQGHQRRVADAELRLHHKMVSCHTFNSIHIDNFKHIVMAALTSSASRIRVVHHAVKPCPRGGARCLTPPMGQGNEYSSAYPEWMGRVEAAEWLAWLSWAFRTDGADKHLFMQPTDVPDSPGQRLPWQCYRRSSADRNSCYGSSFGVLDGRRCPEGKQTRMFWRP